MSLDRGRYRTQFRSAFLVRTPVTADRIIDVAVVREEPPALQVDINYNELVRRR